MDHNLHLREIRLQLLSIATVFAVALARFPVTRKTQIGRKALMQTMRPSSS
jgi:hypothetical protein